MTDKYELKWNKDWKVPEPACLHKWQWSTVFLQNQKTSSCHRPEPEDITPENFKDFHNTPEKLIARQKMLDGQWPGKGCEYCRDIEAVGGASDRVNMNHRSALADPLTPPEFTRTNDDNSIPIKVTPRTLEVNFSNICNQACLYCFSRCSSKIETEERREVIRRKKEEIDELAAAGAKRFFKEQDKERQEKYVEMKEVFWDWMKVNAKQLFNYRILGGEPFYQPEIWENIEFFKENPCRDLNITVFTNLNADPKRFRKAIEELKDLRRKRHIKSVQITISTDSWGPAEEYVRFGSKMDRWKENFTTLEKYPEDFKVSILSTLCNLNVKSAIGIVEIYNESKFRDQKWSAMHFNIAHGHDHLVFDIFPEGFFDEDFDKLYEATLEPHFKDQIAGYKKVANAGEYRPDLIVKLKKYLDNVDRMRGLNWKETFPWLDAFNPNDYTK